MTMTVTKTETAAASAPVTAGAGITPVRRPPALRTVVLCATALLCAAACARPAADSTAAAPSPPAYVPTVKIGRVMHDGDSIQYMELSSVYVYPPVEFKNKKQAAAYMRLVKNVKTVLPLAKEVNKVIIETYEVLRDLPDEEAKQEHMKKVEKDVYRQYKPQMKKLTYAQGKLLIKLIYRECDSSAYDLLKAFLGPVRAGVWQAFSAIFGASLTKEYDPEGTDRLTERVVLLVESGQI